MKNIVLAVAVTLFCLRSAEAGGGLVFFSPKGASYVTAVQYESFSSPSSNLAYITVKGGKRMQIPTDSLVGQIPFPEASGVTSADAESAISQTEMLTARYPQHAKLLQSVGELWKRSLEASKKAQAMPTPAAVASGTPETGPKITMAGPKSEIPILRTKSGQTLKNVTITQFENDKAAVTHSTGMGRIPISDFADLSALPADVQAAVAKVLSAMDAKRKADELRLATEKLEQDRQLEANQKAEASRIAAERLEQERVAEAGRQAEADWIAGIDSQINKLKSSYPEYETELALLKERLTISFRVVRLLDPEKFPIFHRFTGNYYEINLNGKMAILAASFTKFESKGSATLSAVESGDVEVTTNDGFAKTVKIYEESDPGDIKDLKSLRSIEKQIKALEAQKKSKTPPLSP